MANGLKINLGAIGDALTYPLEQELGSTYTDPVANPSNAMGSKASSDTEGDSEAEDSADMRPEGAITGSKKHGVKWKEGKARAKKENKVQGQWAEEDIDFATEKAKTLAPRESAEFDLPEDSQSIVHMPNGTTQKATKMWIRNNGSGTWHGYPKP